MTTSRPDNPKPDDRPTRCGCNEYRSLASNVSRRSVLQGLSGSALAAAVTAATPAWMPRVAYAESASSRDVLVSVFLRGGADGLTLVVPYLENNLAQLRPTLGLRPPDAGSRATLDLDGRFGFAPALAPLVDAYQSEDLAIVHATGSMHETRSHFSAMHFMEAGRPDSTVLTGWLGRHLATVPPLQQEAPLRGIGIGFGLPRSLAGAPLTLPISDPPNFGYAGNSQTVELREAALRSLYEPENGLQDPLRNAATNTFRTVQLLESIQLANYQGSNSRPYPDSDFGNALRSTAALIRADVGVEAAAIDFGGWDTHDEQGPLDGQMNALMTQLANGLAAFHADLFRQPNCNVTLVVMSEFGRNVFENASRGTDHGHGNVMFVLSPAANGGRVHTEWPGLDNEHLWQGQDLDVTRDYRDVLYEVLSKRAGNPDPAALFGDPAYSPVDRQVLRD